MTDEEKAEEYTKGLCKTCTLDTCRNNTMHTCAIKEYIKQAFLAGLKAGKDMNVPTQWHKVADGDLPPENTEVLNDDGVKCIRINGHWRYVYGDEWEDDTHLDHWCEIPKFEEKGNKEMFESLTDTEKKSRCNAVTSI